MSDSRPSVGDIAERGTRTYDERLRSLLEPEHNGKYVVIDVETGEYELDEDHLAASDRAAANRPGAPLYATRVGSRTLGQVGGRLPSFRAFRASPSRCV
jgi:hypothetical protein